jgi:hypothetical protein
MTFELPSCDRTKLVCPAQTAMVEEIGRLRVEDARLSAAFIDQLRLEEYCRSLRERNAEMREALAEFDCMAQEDEQGGHDLLWTTGWQKAVDKARAILAKSQEAA